MLQSAAPRYFDRAEMEFQLQASRPLGSQAADLVALRHHFRYAHLPELLQAISEPCARLAMQLADSLPEGPDLTCGLRDLPTAKDNFVRARLP